MNKSAGFEYLVLLIKAVIFIAACYFLFRVVDNNLTTIKSIEIPYPWQLIGTALSSILIYGVLMMFLVLAWQVLCKFHMPQPMAGIYFKSQVLKYLPGNVFHFAYRHTKAKALGFSHKTLIQASLSETVGLIVTALLTSHLLLFWPDRIEWITGALPIPIWLMVCTELFILIYLIKTLKVTATYSILMCYLLYFLGMGLLTYCLIFPLGFESQHYGFITACFAFSWLAGYLIPGAPGGTGVREAVFIIITSPQIAETEALILIAVIRLTSITAESIIYFMAKPLSQPYHDLAAWFDKTKL